MLNMAANVPPPRRIVDGRPGQNTVPSDWIRIGGAAARTQLAGDGPAGGPGAALEVVERREAEPGGLGAPAAGGRPGRRAVGLDPQGRRSVAVAGELAGDLEVDRSVAVAGAAGRRREQQAQGEQDSSRHGRGLRGYGSNTVYLGTPLVGRGVVCVPGFSAIR